MVELSKLAFKCEILAWGELNTVSKYTSSYKHLKFVSHAIIEQVPTLLPQTICLLGQERKERVFEHARHAENDEGESLWIELAELEMRSDFLVVPLYL